uniref:Valine--tRNA ligase, mitochondrial n=1 Tax=Mastacembelus armatus TaxID=205130 RepID=A0A7N9AW81_9TELE
MRANRIISLKLSGRGAAIFCTSRSTKPSSSSSQQKSSPRAKAEKLKRRREREETILLNRNSSVDDKKVKLSDKEKIVYPICKPPGTKKDTSFPFPSSYSPEYVESSWYQWWEKEGFFSPDSSKVSESSTFSLCIPPPNVTGSLHLGHALTVAVEDALVRWRRMQGYRVLWVPGCDHAGIATQTVVERRLLNQEGKHRQDFTREEFLQELWKWKNQKGEEIYHQLRRLGASLDWSRACFTMDPGFSRAVTKAFVRLCDSGLIYRSEGLVNWSCALESSISDIEVDSKELPGQTMLSVPGYENKVEFGTIVTFAYPIEDGEVEVSTTRPETMLGDVAIAVHPNDPRYQGVHGKHCKHPFTNRLLPIITDSVVDMELGTGAVKVTPAHDHTDFLLSQRHSLPCLTVIAGDGTMMPPCGEWLKVLWFLSSLCPFFFSCLSRSGDIIEPLLKKQWFIQCDEMAKKAIQAVEDGQLEIIPHCFTKTWKNWLSNISDWCISRQLWWGHQIPAYQVELCNSTEKQEWVWGQSENEARHRAAVKYGVKLEDVTLTQDPDVLDTWFSSALFPFAMLGWPEKTTDLQRFYPNSILETGNDLIFFWVARMVMLGTELTRQLPFKQVVFHSLVRDEHGRKMSKSLGNVIDPLDVINGVTLEVGSLMTLEEGNFDPRERRVAMEAQRKNFPKGIPQCGTDALRFALCSHKMQGEDISLSISQVLSCRYFCNKIWHTLRYTLGTTPLSSMDRWICSRLYSTVLQCEKGFEAYELHTVTSALYSFWVHSLCDVYMEYVKPVLSQQDEEAVSVLYHCVSMSLVMLSPFMPFITEELWQRLQPFRPGPAAQTSLCLEQYPCSSKLVGLQPSIFLTITKAFFYQYIHCPTSEHLSLSDVLIPDPIHPRHSQRETQHLQLCYLQLFQLSVPLSLNHTTLLVSPLSFKPFLSFLLTLFCHTSHLTLSSTRSNLLAHVSSLLFHTLRCSGLLTLGTGSHYR